MAHTLTLKMNNGEKRSFTFESLKQAEIYATILIRLNPKADILICKV